MLGLYANVVLLASYCYFKDTVSVTGYKEAARDHKLVQRSGG